MVQLKNRVSKRLRPRLAFWRRGFVPVVLLLAVVSHVLIGPQSASAAPGLTAAEARYLGMLRQGPPGYGGIYPSAGFTEYDLAQSGHQIAYELRRPTPPNGRPCTCPEKVASSIYEASPNMWLIQAQWMVYSAVVVFAPEFMPLMDDRGWGR